MSVAVLGCGYSEDELQKQAHELHSAAFEFLVHNQRKRTLKKLMQVPILGLWPGLIRAYTTEYKRAANLACEVQIRRQALDVAERLTIPA